jgi:hypothetical protein
LVSGRRDRRLSLEATVFEVPLFLRSHVAPEDRIAVREAAEAANDVAMTERVREVGLPKMPRQRHGTLLICQILGMGERQIEELGQLVIDGTIIAGLDGGIGDEPCMAVGGVSASRAAERIARELMEQDGVVDDALKQQELSRRVALTVPSFNGALDAGANRPPRHTS